MKQVRIIVALLIVAAALYGCASMKKISMLSANNAHANIDASEEQVVQEDTARTNAALREKKAREEALKRDLAEEAAADSAARAASANTEVLMEKGENGELKGGELAAARLVAHVPYRREKGGKVHLNFDVKVNKNQQMFDKDWQIRLFPEQVLLNIEAVDSLHTSRTVLDSTVIDNVYLTGNNFRDRQNRGYELYNRFVESIITDTTRFISQFQFEQFLERNIPDLYKFKFDSTQVNYSDFVSAFGVDGEDAIEHYTRKIQRAYNRKKESMKESVFARLVHTPKPDSGVRLDTVIREDNGDFIYRYDAVVNTKGWRTLNNAYIYVKGGIYRYGEKKPFYEIPYATTYENKRYVSFPISSNLEFVKDTVMHTIGHRERKIEDNREYNIAFAVGKDNLNMAMEDNAVQMSKIRRDIRDLMANKMYDLDSIVVTAAASPEGLWMSNAQLANRRARSVISYVAPFAARMRDSVIRHHSDSLKIEADKNWIGGELGGGFFIGEMTEEEKAVAAKKQAEEDALKKKLISDIPDITFISHSEPEFWKVYDPEDWGKLDVLVATDTTIFTDEYRALYNKRSEIANPDARENAMKADPYYRQMREQFYPELRVTKIDFLLHLKKTVPEDYVTDIVDSLYMDAIECCRDKDWLRAEELFKASCHPEDYNVAVVYIMNEKYLQATKILEKQERTPSVNFMLAQCYCNLDRPDEAVEVFKLAYMADEALWQKGVTDQEIATLISRNRNVLKAPSILREEARKAEELARMSAEEKAKKEAEDKALEEAIKALGLN